jgi:hypothetical protein
MPQTIKQLNFLPEIEEEEEDYSAQDNADDGEIIKGKIHAIRDFNLESQIKRISNPNTKIKPL